MSEHPPGLSIDQKHNLLQRFLNRPASELTYGTVRDYCDSFDHISFLTQLQGDLKDSLEELEPSTYDCVYSISVLEHVHEPGLAALFRGIGRFLRPGGYSAHFIDHALAGDGAHFHLRQIAEILTLQSELASEPRGHVTIELISLLNALANDDDTYYLSSYNSFPFRKVVSLHSCKQYEFRNNGFTAP